VKRMNPVLLPKVLSFAPWSLGETPPPLYRLLYFVRHHGGAGRNSGHYTAVSDHHSLAFVEYNDAPQSVKYPDVHATGEGEVVLCIYIQCGLEADVAASCPDIDVPVVSLDPRECGEPLTGEEWRGEASRREALRQLVTEAMAECVTKRTLPAKTTTKEWMTRPSRNRTRTRSQTAAASGNNK
jgi:hypothetical protein